MLITKTVTIKWANNKKWFTSKGYIFTKRGDEFEVKVEELMNSCTVIVNVKCDCEDCSNPYLKPMEWGNYTMNVKEDGKYYCQLCAIKLYGTENLRKSQLLKSISFYEWCYKNLSKEKADEIMLRWDYELNINKYGIKLSPKDVSWSSTGLNKKGYWFKCLDNPIHKSEQKDIRHFTGKDRSDISCNQCNMVAVTHPEFIKYFANEDDVYKYTYGSNKKAPMKCPDCGFIKNMIIANMIAHGLACSKCGDGISYPNKIGLSFLEQLNIDFTPEYSPAWITPKRYDFYFEVNDKKYILEMDGDWHTKDNKMSGQTAEKSKEIDNYKDEVALEHGINIIRVDCAISEITYIKDRILNSELSELFNLDKIDWGICEEFALSNLVETACNIWNNNVKNIAQIAEELHVCRNSVCRYLKQGAEIGWCDYDPKEEHKKNYISHTEKMKIKVICLTTEEIFSSISEASKKYNASPSTMSACCKGVRNYKSTGKHPETKEPLVWMYLKDYQQLNSN